MWGREYIALIRFGGDGEKALLKLCTEARQTRNKEAAPVMHMLHARPAAATRGHRGKHRPKRGGVNCKSRD